MEMITASSSSMMSYSKDTCDFLSHIEDNRNDFSRKEMSTSRSGLCVFEQVMK